MQPDDDFIAILREWLGATDEAERVEELTGEDTVLLRADPE